jgi:hypothetical protein
METAPALVENLEKVHNKTKYVISKRKHSYDYKNKVDDRLAEDA